MKRKLFTSFALGLLLTAMFPFAVFGAEKEIGMDLAGNFFSAGNEVTCEGMTARDVFVAGQDLYLDDFEATGNVFAAGNSVHIGESKVGADVFAAGNEVKIEANTEGNVFGAGQVVKFTQDANAAAAMLAAQNIYYDGSSISASLSGDKVVFDGYVEGDISINASEIIIGEHARIGGKLDATSKTIEVSDDAVIADYAWEPAKEDENVDSFAKVSIWAKALERITSRFYWIPAMLLLTLVLCWLFGESLDGAKEAIKTKSGEMVLWGVLSWCLIPAVCLILAVTVIGLPLAAMICAVYVVLLCAGLTFAGASLGRLCFPKLHPILASVIGVAIIECLKIIPFLGVIVSIAADMYLLGYISRCVYLKKSKKNLAE